MTARRVPYILFVIAALAVIMTSRAVWADEVSTSVIVGNIAPQFLVLPAEATASSANVPANIGDQIVFTGTVGDANNEDYYLAICKTSAATAVDGGPPNCPGGVWCISIATNSGVAASCAYSVEESDDEVNEWYGFACDARSSSAQCTIAYQGSGDSGSPFYVNRAPGLGTVSFSEQIDPGAVQTWTANTATTDPDILPTPDTVQLVVCKTNEFNGMDCTDDAWCSSSAAASGPSCSTTLPSPLAAGTYPAFAFLLDNHGELATTEGVDVSFVVRSSAPATSNIQINGGNGVALTEGSPTNVVLQTVVTDTNSCINIQSVTVSLYRSGVGFNSCQKADDADDRNCYPVIPCKISTTTSCSGNGDANAQYTCVAKMSHIADPTDIGPYADQSWQATFVVKDRQGNSVSTRSGQNVEVMSLLGFDFGETSIDYGNISSTNPVTTTNKAVNLIPSGNVGQDFEVKGVQLFQSNGNSVPTNYQRYSSASDTPFSRALQLSNAYTQVESNCKKSPAKTDTCAIWWGIQIPSTATSGAYSGVTVVLAVLAEPADW